MCYAGTSNSVMNNNEYIADDTTFCIVGLGLMGGSFARALREFVLGPNSRLAAIDRDAEVLARAAESGVIDEGFLPPDAPAALERAGVVIVCLYPAQTIRFLQENALFFKRDAIVTDISGVKGGLEGIRPALAAAGAAFDFISGHPMAGGEKEGFANARAGLFAGRNYILIPSPENRPENIAFLKTLMYKLGFSRIIETDAATHDGKIAFTSQLCHIIACALVAGAEDTSVTCFGGGSFEDLTRIAMINAPLWTELFIANKAALLDRIADFEASLTSFKSLLEDSAADSLCQALTAAREKRAAM